MNKHHFNMIHHIAIIGSEYKRSLKFYSEILNFKIIRETKRGKKNDIKIDLMMNDQTEIELFIKPDAPERVSFPEAKGLRHLAFKTQAIEEDVRYLKENDIRVEEIRYDEITHKKMVFFFDPDGLPLELHE